MPDIYIWQTRYIVFWKALYARADIPYCHILFWFLYTYVISSRQRLTVLIGITPPRQRPGRTLGLNLDYAQVSLSLRMRYRQSVTNTFYCISILRSHLTFIQSIIGIDPSVGTGVIPADGPSVPAIWLSFSGHTGKVPDKHLFNYQRTLEGVAYVPLLISRFFGQKLHPLQKFF